MGSGKILGRSIKKHGIENFQKDILHCCESAEEMFEMEAQLVNKEFIDRTDTYNLKKGGAGGFDYVNSILTNEFKKKRASNGARALQEKRLKNPDFNKSVCEKQHTPEIHKKIVETKIAKYGKDIFATFKGKKHTEKTKDLMSKAKKGKGTKELNSQYGTMWITNGIENKKIKKEEVIPKDWYKGRKIQ
jgi:hypothetical protein